MVHGIYEEVRLNHPDIQRARFSRVTSLLGQGELLVILMWGDKIEPSPEEKEILSKYEHSRSRKEPKGIPAEITSFDGYRQICTISNSDTLDMQPRVSEGRYYDRKWDHSFGEIVSNPRCILPHIAQGLIYAKRELVILKKGQDYWHDTSCFFPFADRPETESRY